jgi:hypothetical protein
LSRLPNQLPENIHQMHEWSGADQHMRTVDQVHRIQRQLSEWIVEAAVERWPDLFLLTEEEALAKIMANAEARWPGFLTLHHAMNEAERAVYRSMKALA